MMETVILFLTVLILGQLGLIYYLRRLVHEPAPVDPDKEAKSHWSLWHRSLRQSQAVLGKAELEGIKIVAGSKYYTKQLEHVYEDQLKLAAERMEKELNKVMSSAQEEYGKYLMTLQEQNQNLVDDAMVSFTKRLEEALTGVETRILKLAQEEEMRVKLEVEAYRQKMLSGVDARVAEVLDEVSKTVLGRGLAATTQTDLIIKALEQAKKEKFL